MTLEATYAGKTVLPPETRTGGESPTRRALRRLLRKKLAVICLVVIAIFYAAGILAPLIAPYGYNDQNLDLSFQGPSRQHVFGTDRLGRDTLSRNIFAARTTVIVTLATLATGFIALPVLLGLVAGYRRGFVDAAINRSGEILASLPGLPMLLLISATMRPRFNGWLQDIGGWLHWQGLTTSGFSDYFLVFGVLSLFGWVGGMRLIRAQVLTLRRSEYVLAAEASGASTWRVLRRHLLPNLMPLIIVSASSSLGAIAGSEIALTFLGVGVQPPHASFGVLITDGASRIALERHPELLLVPGAIIAALIFAFNLLGDALNDVFTPGAV
ncbi:MAG: ABC transporter permease [Dehalococcoidia bacterium]|nr:ABC transporter permease [Dehalococcoidia bacterium]